MKWLLFEGAFEKGLPLNTKLSSPTASTVSPITRLSQMQPGDKPSP